MLIDHIHIPISHKSRLRIDLHGIVLAPVKSVCDVAGKRRTDGKVAIHIIQLNLIRKLAKGLVGISYTRDSGKDTRQICFQISLVDQRHSYPLGMSGSDEHAFQRISTLIISIRSQGNKNCPFLQGTCRTSSVTPTCPIGSCACANGRGQFAAQQGIVVERSRPESGHFHPRLRIIAPVISSGMDY